MKYDTQYLYKEIGDNTFLLIFRKEVVLRYCSDLNFELSVWKIRIKSIPLLYSQVLQSQDCLNHQHVRNSITSRLQDTMKKYSWIWMLLEKKASCAASPPLHRVMKLECVWRNKREDRNELYKEYWNQLLRNLPLLFLLIYKIRLDNFVSSLMKWEL